MVAQRQRSIQVKEVGGDVLWIAKENQPTFYHDLAMLFVPAIPVTPGWSPIPVDCITVRHVEKGMGVWMSAS